MEKEYSTETRFYGGHGVFLEVTRSRWPWWELEFFTLAYFHPFVFMRIKLKIGPIGLGVQMRIGGNKIKLGGQNK